MQNIKKQILTNSIFFFLIYALMFYVVLRSISMVITHDEAYSFYNAKHFWWVETLCTGNTHWFNFLAMKTCILFGFEKTSQLRWFSLLSSGIFLTIIYFWIKTIRDFPVKVFACSVAVLNPFLIDYLSLARGYSTALMFEALSIACYCIALKNNKRSTAVISLFFTGMAAIANFNFFYFFVAFCCIYFFRYFFKRDFAFLKSKLFYLEMFFAFGIAAVVIKALRFITTCSNDIGAYGGEDLISGVFMGYVHTLVYSNDNVNETSLRVFATIFCVLVMSASVYGIWLHKQHRCPWYTLSAGLLLLMILLTMITKLCFGVLYPTYRTALMFYPLIAMVLIGFFNALYSSLKMKAIILYSFSGLLALHFIMNMSLTKSFDYWQQADTKICFTYLDSLSSKKVGIAPELYGVYRNYYQLTDKHKFMFQGKSINTAFPGGLDTNQELKNFEYLVLFPPYNLNFYKNNTVKLEGVTYYKNTGTLVVRVMPFN
ncbi:MAG: hypothetical protein H7141_08130 [Burkholderiales bacterium]|nr:hypothetical protein [Bacteroidia bacterium]